MIKRCILFLMLSLCSNSNRKEDIFNFDADDIFASEIGGNFYEVRKRLQSIPYNITDTITRMSLRKQNATNLKLNTTTKSPDISTTERILLATIPSEIAAEFKNTSVEDIKMHRLKQQLDKVLNSNRSVSDYLADSDVDTWTRRFDQLVEENKKIFAFHTRRELYDKKRDNASVIWSGKKRLLNLMTHFVYISRYKLVYPQLLRKKYISSPVYKIGFLFALLRHLKNMQKWIYNALKVNGFIIVTLYYDLKLIEKLQRLDVDIKDVVLLIHKLEYRANIDNNPNYYDYSLET